MTLNVKQGRSFMKEVNNLCLFALTEGHLNVTYLWLAELALKEVLLYKSGDYFYRKTCLLNAPAFYNQHTLTQKKIILLGSNSHLVDLALAPVV